MQYEAYQELSSSGCVQARTAAAGRHPARKMRPVYRGKVQPAPDYSAGHK